MSQDWYSRSGQDIQEEMAYLVRFPDGKTDYVDEEKYEEIKDRVELLKRIPKRDAPMKSDALERFDRYLH